MDLFRSSMSPEAGEAVKKILTPDENGRVYCGEGPVTLKFEQEFTAMAGLPDRPLGVNSCSAAIDLGLHLIGLQPEDEVIVSPMTCSASNGSVVTRGARLVWADVDPITGLIDPESVSRLISPWTKAIIAVDWSGRTCDYGALRAALRGHNIPIIEDAAHKFYLDDNFGDIVCWSFGPIKHLSTGGYGGAIMVDDTLYDRARLLRWHGLDRLSKADFRCSQDILEVGYRYHMTDDMASIGLANMSLAMYGVEMARAHAQYYCKELVDIPGIKVPPFDNQCDYWLFGIIVEGDRDEFAVKLAERGIPTSRAHARNDRHSGFAAATATQDGSLSGVQYFDDHQLNIPVGWWITDKEIDYIIESVKELASATIMV